jgi:hypothetical protein
VAKWDRGKLIEGNYFFVDKLEYIDSNKAPDAKDHKKVEQEQWVYCTDKDRQFYTEISKGTLRPDGLTLLSNDIEGLRSIPEGTYDIGDGYFDPAKRVICHYDGNFKRDLNEGEETWINEKCRYNPQKFEDDTNLDGANDKIVSEMIKMNQNPELKAQRAKGIKQE